MALSFLRAPPAFRLSRLPKLSPHLSRPQSCRQCRGTSTSFVSVAAMARERPLWLPGSTPPPHLDGSLAGDFGFDPLELGKEPRALRWYVQAELLHARFAMAAVAGILFTDLLRTTGLKELPVWYEAGATKFEFADTSAIFIVQLILMGFAETKRYMDFVTPGSQATEDSFFGFEPALEGLQNGYPGGPLFDPLGLGRDMSLLKSLQEKEIKNGRLAMVAMVGFSVQAFVTKTGPINNLLTHLSDPWHRTIVETFTIHVS
ncbi:hypothetical protein O6H91_07G116700 [Diphasiastrum complanatum]|uniref:Uncharacterized protein n=2 Tax=Diphasiastrum complanatum TaxID=34168 RepID=A0ACC2D8W7_DIPCM|nr:hypothetical protein O6H91_07G115800 [Diphasiastrum complanatum]KAJ7550756.1 hypothetical protein O6H91_07G116700 [Diphasiastrum complanatum]